jgi:phosphoglycerate dehydrogenase-like enzyme
MLCCHYFAKNMPRFLDAKSHKHWDVFETEELRDKTLGLIG